MKQSFDNRIYIIGAGAWGLALANVMAHNVQNINIITNSQNVMDEINKHHSHAKVLPNVALLNNIVATNNYTLPEGGLVFICIPTQNYANLFGEISKQNIPQSVKFVLCSKGVCNKTLKLTPEIFECYFPGHSYAVLSGANFAKEVAMNKNSSTTIAGKDGELLKNIKGILQTPFFKVEEFNDPLAVALCGVLKNIYAIACGIAKGLNIGENFSASILANCLKEFNWILNQFQSDPDAFFAQSGAADLLLSCTNPTSRNMSFGMQVANGKGDAYLKEILVEGYFSLKSFMELLKLKEINPPVILKTTHAIVFNGGDPKSLLGCIVS